MKRKEKELLIELLEKAYQVGEGLGFNDDERSSFLEIAQELEETLDSEYIDEIDFNC